MFRELRRENNSSLLRIILFIELEEVQISKKIKHVINMGIMVQVLLSVCHIRYNHIT